MRLLANDYEEGSCYRYRTDRRGSGEDSHGENGGGDSEELHIE